jgi:hypothetical protein
MYVPKRFGTGNLLAVSYKRIVKESWFLISHRIFCTRNIDENTEKVNLRHQGTRSRI